MARGTVRHFTLGGWRTRPPFAILHGVRPTALQPIGSDLAIKWPDGMESFIPLEALRRACPCAGCQGERDVMGNLYKGPPAKLTASSFELRQLIPVGAYGVQPVWADGHQTGLFTFQHLRELGASLKSGENPD
jgi:DUF971 family protein